MEIVVFAGCQGAGKTTFYRQRFFDTHVRVSLDMLKTRHREKALLETCLRMKQRMVIDNTNPTASERGKYIALARDHGFSVTGYRFEAPLEHLLQRNATRTGKARVPDLAILGTRRKFEPPSLVEGYDALFRVDIAENGEFSVEEIFDEVR